MNNKNNKKIILKILIIFALSLSLSGGLLVYKYNYSIKPHEKEIKEMLNTKNDINEYDFLSSSKMSLFKLQDIKLSADIKDILLSSENKIIIINFWASWCSPCVKEIPLLNEFYKNNKDKVEIIGIAVDNLDNIKQFNTKIPLNYYISSANLDGIELSKKLGNNIGVLPYTLVIKNKKIMDKHIGELEQKHLQSWLHIKQ